MLAIEDRLAARRDGACAIDSRMPSRLSSSVDSERDMHLIVPALGDECDRVAIGREQAGDAGIVGGRAARALRHPEGREFRLARRLLAEKLRVERIGAGIAALDVVDAEIVEQRRDMPLVVERKIDAGRLRAVAQVVSKR